MGQYIPLLLLYVIYVAQAANPLAYLYLNTTAPARCIKPANSSLCDLDYNIFQFNDKIGRALTAQMFAVPELAQRSLDFYPKASAACRKSIQYYTCNNTFAVCKSDSKGTVTDLRYNWKQTLAACAKANKVCPVAARPYLTYNCMMINKNPMDYATCSAIKSPPASVCSKFRPKYTYPLPGVKAYKLIVESFGQAYTFFYKKFLPNDACRDDFLKINCNLNTGAICSTDGKLRMYAISQQECTAVVNRCFKNPILAALKPVYTTMCGFYPDQSAPTVPLPK